MQKICKGTEHFKLLDYQLLVGILQGKATIQYIEENKSEKYTFFFAISAAGKWSFYYPVDNIPNDELRPVMEKWFIEN